MGNGWPALPYEDWSETCETLHAHTQVLGKLAAALAPPEPQLLHAALRLTARGWETRPLPAPDGSGAIVVALDLHAHEAVVEHSDGRAGRVALAPHRSVGEVTRELLATVRSLAGPVEVVLNPQETDWTKPLDEDDEHATYDPAQVDDVLRRRHPGGARPRRAPRALPRALDPGERVVGLVRPRRQPLLGPARAAALRRLHHAQLDGRAGGRRRLVARRCPLPARRVLRLRPSVAAGLLGRHAHARRRALGRDARRVPPRLGQTSVAADDPYETALGFLRSAVAHGVHGVRVGPRRWPASALGDPPPVA